MEADFFGGGGSAEYGDGFSEFDWGAKAGGVEDGVYSDAADGGDA